jgi:ubiquitin-conjugating enzyme E2 D/E/ubiquitin-conjugating enzyme E2 H
MSSAIRSKRILRDIVNMRKAGLVVTDEKNQEFDATVEHNAFHVVLKGPADSPYEGYNFIVGFTLTEHFPFKSPSVGFRTRIYHPNVDEASGSICLDSLNKTWSPAFSLENVMQQLSYLLQYPNPADPFNREAAALMTQNEPQFKAYAKMHCAKHALKQE